MNEHLYLREPISYIGKIPVFSKSDSYILNYDRISGDHLEHLSKNGHNPFMEETHWQEIETATEKMIRNCINPGDSILDVGVGLGRLLERFPDCRRYGMDISAGYLEVASQKGIDVCLSKIEDMPYRHDFFDLIVCTDVLEHVFDLHAAVSNIISRVRLGGHCVIRVPYRENLRQYVQPDFPYEYVHMRSFDEFELQMLCEKILGQSVVCWGTCGYRFGSKKVAYMPYKLISLIQKVVDLVLPIGSDTSKFFYSLLIYPAEVNFVIKRIR